MRFRIPFWLITGVIIIWLALEQPLLLGEIVHGIATMFSSIGTWLDQASKSL